MRLWKKAGFCMLLAAMTAAVPVMSPLVRLESTAARAEGEPVSEEAATFVITEKPERGIETYLPYLVISGYDKAKFNSATVTVQSYTNGAWTDLGSKIYNSISGSLKVGSKEFEGLTFDVWYRVKIVSGANTDYSNVVKITDPAPAAAQTASPSGNSSDNGSATAAPSGDGNNQAAEDGQGKDANAPRDAYELQHLFPELFESFGKAKTEPAELVDFKTGIKSVTDTALYKGTAEITKVTEKAVTFQYTLESKVPELSWHISGGSQSAGQGLGWGLSFQGAEEGEGLDLYSETPTEKYTCTATTQLSNLNDGVGAAKVKFEIEPYYPKGDEQSTYRFGDVSSFSSYNEETVFYYVSPPDKTDEHYLDAVKANTLTFGPVGWSSPFADNTGTKVYYRVEKTKKWSTKTFQSGKTLKLTGLQYGKFYEVRFARYVTEKLKSGKSVTKEAAMSKSVIQPTAPKDKPVIASVKVSGAKKLSGNRPGYWDAFGKWHPGSNFSRTAATVTITLKKGSTATHIAVRAHGGDYTIAKLNGKKAVLKNVNLGGYGKGKQVPLSAAFTFYGKADRVHITPYGPWSAEKKTTVR